MIIAQSDAHNFDAALNNNGVQPVGPRSVEAFQRTDVDSTDAQLQFPQVDISSDRVLWHQATQQFLLNCLHVHRHETALIAPR